MKAKDAAQKLSNMGRGGDTELAHVNKREMGILEALGGSGTVNPKTGLKEFMDGIGGIGGMSHASGFHGGSTDGAGNTLSSVGNAGFWGPINLSEAEIAAANGEGIAPAAPTETGVMGYTAADYDRALSAVPSIDRVSTGPLGLGPTGDATVGGIMTGGPLNGWGTMATLASMAVPALAAPAMALSLGNLALGATNSIGLTDTGALTSPKDTVSNLMGTAKDYGGYQAENDANPYSGTQGEAPTQAGAVQATQTSPVNGGAAPNEPVRDPGILAAITGLPAQAFGAAKQSPYATGARNAPEIAQGLLQSSLWGKSRAGL